MATSTSILLQEGLAAFGHRMIRWLRGERRYYRPTATTPGRAAYDTWIDNFERHDVQEAQRNANNLSYLPTISIIMPVYNTERYFLERALDSVHQQAYRRWELCICDDGSTLPHVKKLLTAATQEDDRVQVKFLELNTGIAGASNEALFMATGEFVVLMDHDDELPPHALYFLAKTLNQHPDADFIYSDEDKIDVDGRRHEPFFKPDWSPDLLLSFNYLNHLTAVRASFLREIGGFRDGYEGSQDYDLYLRIVGKTSRVHHIPKVLYHWRATPSSAASDANLKRGAHAAARKALQDHLEREQIDGEVMQGDTVGRWRVRYAIKGQPRVSIIIPTGGHPLLPACVNTVIEKSTYPGFEIVIIDNSRDETVLEHFGVLARKFGDCRYIDARNQPFNFSTLCNQAAWSSDSPLLLFLNDDTKPINEDWLEAMIEHGQRQEVGAVGAKLLYPDETIQHAGVMMGVFQNAGHAFKYMPADKATPVYFDLPHVVRNTSAVTGACLMTRRDVFQEMQGFEEFNLQIAFQDVDYCLRLNNHGYRVVYTPHARLYHHEAKTKIMADDGVIPDAHEVAYMQQKWGNVIARDPYYNPNLTRSREDYSLRT